MESGPARRGNAASAGMQSGRGLPWWRCQVAVSVLRLGAVVIVPLLVFMSYRAAAVGQLWLCLAHIAVLAAYLGAALWGRMCALQVGAVLLAHYWLAWLSLYRQGNTALAQVLLLSAVVLAALLHGRVAGIGVLALNVLLLAAAGWSQAGGAVGIDRLAFSDADVWPGPWAERIVTATVIGGALVYAVERLVARLGDMLAESTRQVRHLEARDGLLTRETEELSQRNAGLVRQSDALHTVVSVVRNTAPALHEDALLDDAAALIGETCGFDHVGIFLLDPSGEWAELRASSSSGGRRMLSRQHRLRVGGEGIVGLVTASGAAHVAPQVADDLAYYQNPDLPETRSEITVPMRDEGRTIGALDIQQASPAAFGSGDIDAVQALADVVVALHRNGRFFRQVQESLAAERRAYAELSAQAWLDRTRQTKEIGYRYEQGRTHRLPAPGAARADSNAPAPHQRTWPLSIRGRFAGMMEARKSPEKGNWTEAEQEFVETVIEQLGPALESARLHEDTQSRAAWDRLLADVTARTRETLDLDTVLKTAADEVYIALGLSEVVIHLLPVREPTAVGEGH